MKRSDANLWPIPNYRLNDQPHFMFVITQPYSGSTALAKLLASSKYISMLNECGEGQWLIPGLCQLNRWRADLDISEESIRAVWLSEYQSQQRADSAISMIVEKSPPNMMRIESIIKLFDNFTLLALNRNPYAQCSSTLHRRKDAHSLTKKQRMQYLKNIIDKWIARSEHIKSLTIQFSMPCLTYEAFCSSPNILLDMLSLSDKIKMSIDLDKKIKVKDYTSANISNHNDIQIARLSDNEIDLISSRCAEQTELLNYYNYDLL